MLLGGARGTFPGRLMWACFVLFASHNTHCRGADAASPGPGALGPGPPWGVERFAGLTCRCAQALAGGQDAGFLLTCHWAPRSPVC